MCDDAARILKVVELCRSYERSTNTPVTHSDVQFLLKAEREGRLNDIQMNSLGFYLCKQERKKQ